MGGLGKSAPVVGVDLGGTKILVGVVGADHAILARSKRSTPSEAGGPAILSSIVATIDQALSEAGLGRADIAGIGIGSPGPIDQDRGVIRFSANMNVKDWALGTDLIEAIGRPTLLRNDVRVGGYGEFRLGSGRGFKDVLVAFVGTGIGGCCVVNGKIVEGATGNSGEIGHIVVKAKGPLCGCGRRGCLEALASRSAIARRVVKATRKGEQTILSTKVDRKSGKLKSRDLADALEQGDLVAVREVERAARYLGLGLGGLVNLLGPEVVVVGGGVVEALGSRFIDLVRISAREQILVDPHERIQIVPAALGDDAGILGAALMALEEFGA